MQSTPIINILIGSFAISFGLLVLTGIILAIRLYNNKEYFKYCNLHKDDPITPDEEIGEGEREWKFITVPILNVIISLYQLCKVLFFWKRTKTDFYEMFKRKN